MPLVSALHRVEWRATRVLAGPPPAPACTRSPPAPQVEEIASAKERDHFMSPEQAREFGLIDEVVSTRDGPTSAPAEAPAAMEAVG